VETVHELVEEHLRFTASELAGRVLDDWELHLPQFVKVMPTDYKRVLQARRSAQRPTTNVPARPRLRAVEG